MGVIKQYQLPVLLIGSYNDDITNILYFSVIFNFSLDFFIYSLIFSVHTIICEKYNIRVEKDIAESYFFCNELINYKGRQGEQEL